MVGPRSSRAPWRWGRDRRRRCRRSPPRSWACRSRTSGSSPGTRSSPPSSSGASCQGAPPREVEARDLEARDKKVSVKGAAHRSLSYGEIITASVKQANGDPIIGKGYHKSVPDAGLDPSLSTAKGRWTEAYGFASQLAEGEVDTWTGRGRVLRVVP